VGDTGAGGGVPAIIRLYPPLRKEDERNMVIPYNKSLKEISKNLRRNSTEAERRLWNRLKLRHLGFAFYRQKPIGDYIVDFYCPKARLVVEVDGGQHLNAETNGNDKVRDKYMRGLGLDVLRFSNLEVMNDLDKVVEKISKNLPSI
jgi:very-short-patch-repair endonuclease